MATTLFLATKIGPASVRSSITLRFTFLLVGCALANLAYGGYNSWTSNGPNLPSVQVLASVPTNPQIIYAGTARGLYKSSNGGLTWSLRVNPNPGSNVLIGKNIQAVAVDPTNAQIIYAAVQGEGVYKSVNGGFDWVQVINGLTNSFVTAIAINPLSPTTIYVGTAGGGIFKSNNGGGIWFTVNTGITDLFIFSLALDPSAPATLYVGTTFAIYKTTSAGGSWSPRVTGLPNVLVKSIVVTPGLPKTIYAGTDGSGVYKSIDGAAHWVEANTGLPASPIFINTLAVDPVDNRIVYAGLIGGGIFKTINSGASWLSVSTLTVKDQDIAALAVPSQTPRTVFASVSGKGIAKTIQGGGRWILVNSGLADVGGFFADRWSLVIDPNQVKTLYAGATVGGAYKSVDGGINWLGSGLAGESVFDLAMPPTNNQNLFAATNAGVYKSTNGGASWLLDNDGMGPIRINALATHPTNPSVVYAASDGGNGGGVFWTQNGGDTWTPRRTGMPNGLVVSSITIAPNNPLIAFASSGGALFKSIDGGGNWTQINLSNVFGFISIILVDPNNANTVYVGANGIYKNTNGGNGTWTSLNIGLPQEQVYGLVQDPINPQTFYASLGSLNGSGGVFKSTNSGQNWSILGTGLASFRKFDYSALALDASGKNLYAASLGIFHYLTTPDQLGSANPTTQSWLFDLNRDGLNNGCPPDRCTSPFGTSQDLPVIGDWNGTGRSLMGFFRPSDKKWYLDTNGNRKLDACGVDRCLGPFGNAGDVPVSGDWFGLDFTAIGVFRPNTGQWLLDNGNGVLESCLVDKCFGPFGQAGDKPIVGDWRGIGRSLIGIFRPSTKQFIVDWNANGKLEACTIDKCLTLGLGTDIPISGDWFGIGKTGIGLFRPASGLWFIDNGNFVWQGCILEFCTGPFGQSGSFPLSGVW